MTQTACRMVKAAESVAIIAIALVTVAPAHVDAQSAPGAHSWSAADAPRFLKVPADSTQAPVLIDPSDVPLLRHRIALRLTPRLRRDALKEIARVSGIQFVFADDVLATSDSVQLQADDITVTAALTEVLLGAGVDVALGVDGNAILVKRGAITSSITIAAAKADIIRGRVTTDSGRALAGAQIIATRAPDRAEFRANTNDDGQYRIVVDSGTGDYLVHISNPAQPTWLAFRKRVTRTTPADSVFVVDAVLKAPVAQQMSTVTVQARKPTPTRNADDPMGPGVGATEVQAMGVAASLAPDLKGDINATALTLPGFTPTAGGYSVLGNSSAQNGTTLNGMAFVGASVPREAQARTTYTTSTYDAARGWFSGGQASVTLAPGSLFSDGTARLTLDAPSLQYGDPVAARLGSQYTKSIASFGGSGLAAKERLTYNYGLDLTRQTTGIATLTSLDADVLEREGVSRDSVLRLIGLMNTAHIPISVGGVPAAKTTNTASFITRLNTPEYDFNTFEQKRHAEGLVLSVNHSQTDAAQLSPLSTPARDGLTRSDAIQLQGLYSGFVTKDLLEDVQSSLSWSNTTNSPYLNLPAGNVLVGSTFADGTPGITTLGFGGLGVAASTRAFTWETQSETKFYAPGRPKHRVKINADLRFDATASSSSANGDGTFTYNSLSDLAANTPASFTRALNNPTRTGAEWNAFASVGDYYRVSQTFQLLYGARVEGNVFAERPAFNPAVDAAFGARTDYVPNTMGVSPRIGFTYIYSKKPRGTGIYFNQVGQFLSPPVGVLSGGIGEFRSMMSPSLLSNASVNTGLSNGFRQVSCIGSAIPMPDWSAYLTSNGNIPTDCVAGAPSSGLRDTAPGVQLINRSYDAPRSWRANLRWTTSHDWLMWSIEAAAAYNLNQPGQYDLNFNNTPRFTLSDEGRPVYVQPSSIVESSGVVSPLDARTNQAFGRVISARSDGRSEAQQVILTLSPDMGRYTSRFYGSLSYVLAHVRQLQRGFDESTFDSPDGRSWSRSDIDYRHTFTLQAGVGFKYASVTLFGQVRSGAPFTPMVGSDVNGDGLSNDRAFIFNPATATDPQLAADTRALLASATPAVRHCLTSQFGTGAAQGSCEGPWTASVNGNVSINTYNLGGFWRRLNISLYFNNPLGGLDQLLHGSNLQGWGNAATPNPTLYFVQGFDAAHERFLYSVNPRFGDTRPSNTIQAPFRVTLDVRLRYAPDIGVQQLDRWLRPGRDGMPGPKLSAVDLKRRYSRNVPDAYRPILQESDSLLLTTEQLRRLSDLQKAYQARVDSVWTDLTNWMAALPDHFDVNAVMQRQESTIDEVWEMGRIELQQELPNVLSPVQIQMLPGQSGSYFRSKSMKGSRMFSMAPLP